VELLAQAAAKATAPLRPDLVDESRLCGSPGKIVDVGLLDQILKMSPEHQLFYGPGKHRVPCLKEYHVINTMICV
jgi:hypothetical protein